MPFKSQKQRAKFAALVEEGKMSKSTFDKWQSETGDAKLPERVSKQKPVGIIKAIKGKK